MQSVSAAFTAEESDSVRKIAYDLQVSWKKQTTLGNRTFTIGVSTIGGPDIIGINPGAIGSPGNYRYYIETDYVEALSWERSLNIPMGGLTKGSGEATLINTSKRFTPDYMGGDSELFTSVGLSRRPFIIGAGFNFSGIDNTIPVFTGITRGIPRIDEKGAVLSIQGFDYVDFFQNRFADQTVMFTSQTTDQILTRLMQDQGLSTAQYEFDTGLNEIPFGYYEPGDKLGQIINELVEAENGHFFQDEEGKFRFYNRQHFGLPPFNSVQRILATAQVLEAEAPDIDHLINTVEIRSKRYAKQPNEQLFKLAAPVEVTSGQNTEVFVNFDNPVLQLDTIQFYTANTLEDGTGSDITSSVSVHSVATFTNAAKIVFTSSASGFITQLSLYGRSAKPVSDIYLRDKDDSSVTAYEEQPIEINNKYIQDSSWAASLSRLLLNQYSDPDRLQRLTIRAIPEMQLGDLISWRGLSWRVLSIKAKIGKSVGFIQEILISQSEASSTSYFTIGVSTIGGSDIIAP